MPPHPATVAPSGAVLITGASTGIGAATAAALADAGFFVFAGVRSPGAGAALVTSLGGLTRAAALRLDVTDPASIEAATLAVAAALESTGEEGKGSEKSPPPRRLAALVNNAGVSLPGPLLACPPSELESALGVNLTGALAVTRAVGPLLGIADAVGVPGLGPAWRRQAGKEGGEEGAEGAPLTKTSIPPLAPLPALAPPSATGRGRPVIVNISSVAGRVAGPFMGGYAASKHGLEGASDALRRECAPFGVEVVVVGEGDEKETLSFSLSLLDREGKWWCAAAAVLFFFLRTFFFLTFFPKKNTQSWARSRRRCGRKPSPWTRPATTARPGAVPTARSCA